MICHPIPNESFVVFCKQGDGEQSEQSENEFSSDSDDDLDDGSGEPSPKKRKLTPIDERLLRLPLERGWRRETLIRGLSRSGMSIKGEVTYITPCNRRFKQYPELLKVCVYFFFLFSA